MTPAIRIQRGTITDIPFLKEMLYEAIFWKSGGERFPKEQVFRLPQFAKQIEDWHERPTDTSFIARDSSGQPLGAVWYRYWTDDNHVNGYVDHQTPEIGIAVHPEARGYGIGRALMTTIIDDAKEREIERLSLSVEPRNYARQLFQSLGFIHIGNVNSAWTMVLKLPKVSKIEAEEKRQLSETQVSVFRGMGAGFMIAYALIVGGIWLNPFRFPADLPLPDRLAVAIQVLVIPAFFLTVAIGLLASHRFFDPKDIQRSGLLQGSERAALFQTMVQNTLEQTILAAIVYLVWAVIMPGNWLSVVPLAAIAFGFGRVIFFIRYFTKTRGRALGFTLTFYPSLLMLLCLMIIFLWQQFGALFSN